MVILSFPRANGNEIPQPNTWKSAGGKTGRLAMELQQAISTSQHQGETRDERRARKTAVSNSTPVPILVDDRREPGTRLPKGWKVIPELLRKGGLNPILHLEHLLDFFVGKHVASNVRTHPKNRIGRGNVFIKALDLMQALADRATRGKLAPLTSLHRRERWHSATYAIERVSKEIAATDPETGMRKGTISGFRDAVVAVGDLAGRLGILSVMWDELREGVSKLQSERGDRNGEVEIWPLSKRVRNQEGKREGTTKRKVIGDLRGYLGIKVMMEELTEAAEMANGAAGKRMVWSWDVNIDDENYVSGDDEVEDEGDDEEEDEGDVEGEEEIQDLGDQDEDMEIA